MTTDIEAADDDGSVDRISLYGLVHDGEASERDKVIQVVALLTTVLRHHGIDVRPVASSAGRALVVNMPAGHASVIEVTVSARNDVHDEVLRLQRAAAAAPRFRHVLLSMEGYTDDDMRVPHPVDAAGGLILIDRTHFEAILYGLIDPEVLLAEVAHHADFEQRPWTSLTDLLVMEPASDPAQFQRADRRPAPWNIVGQAHARVRVRHVLTGDRGWGSPHGFTAADGQLLLTVEHGIVQADLARGSVGWLLPLLGCHGAPLVRDDGTVLVLCRDGVVAWKDGVLTPVGGGFTNARALMEGPGMSVWVLAGHGTSLGDSDGTLALTRLGDGPGRQHTHRIYFNADVRTAGWLEDLRFFLAAPGHSAVIDLARSSEVRPEDRIESPHDRPNHIVVINPRRVITAAASPNGVHASVYRTDIDTGTSTLIAELNSNRVDGLARNTAGDLLLLGDVRGNDVTTPCPIVVAISPVSAGVPAAAASGPPPEVKAPNVPVATNGAHGQPDLAEPTGLSATPAEDLRRVSIEARGMRKDYKLDPRPLVPAGGQGTVFGAVHKPTGQRVAFKRLNQTTTAYRARMRREIEAAQRFGWHQNVMPVLDFDSAADWFVMPIASHSAQGVAADLADDEALRKLIAAICEALREPHQAGWIHRDLKPDNVLWLEDRWVVADWGLGRRPRGQTTDPNRTRAGTEFGTPGFAAPELWRDAHAVSAAADIYSIGQIIGWALTGAWPAVNVPLLPSTGPWRNVVKAATQALPELRPATVDDLLLLIAVELDPPAELPISRAEHLLARVRDDDDAALDELVRLIAGRAGDYELYMDVLTELIDEQVRKAVTGNPSAFRDIVQAVPDLHSNTGVVLEYGDVDRLVTWFLTVAYQAEKIEEWDLMEDVADAILYLDLWDRWNVQSDIRAWFATRTGHAAAVVAAVIRRNPDNHRHFVDLVDDRQVDHRIRAALVSTSGRAS
ncbi:protein kinase domain-containing protein [Dactylosporangium sp. CA-233914]|uniref:protein kinase domain-containing protein n=1 Tax=Dactylosporangium sp. CA-233914 TaxID=3239934 RepID=UPI003D90D11C